MRNLWKSVLALCSFVMGLGVGAPAQAASGVGPYYAMPAWDQTLPAASRFIVLINMASQAVLDRETGLVWEQSPSTTVNQNWFSAHGDCNRRTVGNRKGWRLPTIQELASLVDATVPFPGPTLPAGHPFINVQGGFYWSATTSGDASAWGWVSTDGRVDPSAKFADPTARTFVWCVRGGQGVDAQ